MKLLHGSGAGWRGKSPSLCRASNPRRVGHGFKGSRNAPLPRRRRLGSNGAGTPLGRWGLGSAEGSPLVRERLDADFRAIARGMQRESASVSLAKIGAVLPRTSCGQRKPVLSCFRTELFASCLMGLLHPQRALPTCNWCFFLLLHCGQGCRVSLGRQCRGRLCPASISPASPTWKR